MRLEVLLLIVGLIIVAFVIWNQSFTENFFGNLSVTVSWQAPVPPYPDPLLYTWAACISPASGSCDPNPANWPIQGGTPTPATSVTLNNANCNGCDFGQTLNFAVMSTDTVTFLTSSWTTSTIVLTPSTTQISVTLTDSSGAPLHVNSQDIGINITSGITGTVGTPINIPTQVVLTRNGTPYTAFLTAQTTVPSGPPPITYSYAVSLVSSEIQWSPSAPGPIENGDNVVASVMIYSGTTNVLYYGPTSVTVSEVAPPAPSGLSWSIQS